MTRSILFVCGLLFSQLSHGASGWISAAHITRTLTDSHYGGCMVALDVAANSTGLNCPSAWISLDCDGVVHTQAQANAMWSSALMAFALNKQVLIFVDDANKEPTGGHCIARRLDVLQ